MARHSKRKHVTRTHARHRIAAMTKQSKASSLRRAIMATLRAPKLASGSLLSGLLLAGTAFANPENGTVTAGAATIVAATPQRLNVVQTSDSAIINWQGFSIAQGEHTDFQQPSSSSVTLNRVRGDQISLIAGNLTANGIVMLVNPNGVVFGETGHVDVGGLVATTANIRDEDFLARQFNFDQASPFANAAVRNAGTITIKDQGLAALVAPSVQNSGVIQARLGKVSLGGAQTFSLDFQGDGLLSFSPGSAVQGVLAANSGRITADGGIVQMAASAVKDVVDQVINTSGVIEARSVSTRNGRIILSGGDSGTIQVGGKLDVSSADGKGGDVRISGDRIAVTSGANIDASGATGGGRIDVGLDANGNWSGAVRVASGALLNADARDNGNGGVINVLSERSTGFAGHISARGGAQGGDGGQVEVSGRDKLSITGSVDLTAANGNAGHLLLDPATLTIIDAAATNGSQDTNASDGSISFEDQDLGQNTLSRGTLEALSGNANITLEATGLITIEAMDSDLIDLQTGQGYTFTLRSTLTGGIRFVNADTEIRTQGGNITLQALRSGEILNLGRLTTQGGDIVVTAAGVVEIANVLDASTGNAMITSLSNSIRRRGSGNVIGTNVTLDASYGHIGEEDAAIVVNTANLTLATGGNLYVQNEVALNSLSITSIHATDDSFDFELTAPLLIFDVEDDGGEYELHTISSDGDLNLSFTGDSDMQIGTIYTGTGDIALTSTEGYIYDDGDEQTFIVGDELTVDAFYGIGGEGGFGGLYSSVAKATLTASNGGAYLINQGALELVSLNADGDSGVGTFTGDLTVGLVSVDGDLILASQEGNIISVGGPNAVIDAEGLEMHAGLAIGSVGTPIATHAEYLRAEAQDGIYVSTTDDVYLDEVVSLNGPITITAEGEIEVDYVDAGSGAVTLIAGEGGIEGVGFRDDFDFEDDDDKGDISALAGEGGDDDEDHEGPHVVGGTFSFIAGEGGDVELYTAVGSVTGIAAEGSIDLQQTGAITLTSLRAEGEVEVTAQDGNVTVIDVTGEAVFISADDASIIGDANPNTRIEGEEFVGLRAYFDIGDDTLRVQTRSEYLYLENGGDVYVDNLIALDRLTFKNFHDVPGAHTFELSSPYLNFDVVDDGTQFTINDITGVTLSDLSFQGDQTIVVDNINTPRGRVSLTSTQGDLLNDADDDSQIRAEYLRLTTGDGSIGETGGNGMLQVNTSSLFIEADAGDVLITNLTDLYELDIRHRHDEDDPADYQLDIEAPNLRFDMSDSSDGYALDHISDTSGLSFSFMGDRTITVGAIDLTREGYVELTSADGSILDDGNQATHILGSYVELTSYEDDIGGSAANADIDVVAIAVTANAGEGGVYLHAPYPINQPSLNGDVFTENTNRAITFEVYADDPIRITVDNGDLRVSEIYGDDSVTLTASNGSILNSGGFGGGFGLQAQSTTIYADGLTLSASDAIGAKDSPLIVNVFGNHTLTAGSGGIHLENLANIELLTASATGDINIAANRITLGAVDAAQSSVTLFAGEGMIDDADANTRVAGGSVSLGASFGNIGDGSAIIGVNTPQLILSGRESFYINNSSALSALDITTESGSGSHTYSIAATGLTFDVTNVDDTTALAEVGNDTALSLTFSTHTSLSLGALDVNSGIANLAAGGDIVDDGDENTNVAASSLSLSAQGGIGVGGALAVAAEQLSLRGAGSILVNDSVALSSLELEVTGGSTKFGISAQDQTYALNDDGNTFHLETISGPGLTNLTVQSNKSLSIGTIAASGSVSLSTTSGGIGMDGANGSEITASDVTLNTSGSYEGHIGSAQSRIAVDTSTLVVRSTGNIYATNDQNLDSLGIELRHANFFGNYGVSVAADNISNFSITDGGTVQLSNITAADMAFSLLMDRAIQVGTIDVGLGAVGLMSAANSSGAVIVDDDNQTTRITASAVALLTAPGTNGSIGSSGNGVIEVTTADLTIRSTGHIYVTDNKALDSLSVTALHIGNNDNVYSIAAPGLVFSVADQNFIAQGGRGTVITSVDNDGADLDFTFETDRGLQVVSIDAAGGDVVLDTDYSESFNTATSIYDDGNNNTRIVADSLTLLGRTVGNSQGSSTGEIDTDVNSLGAQLMESLYLVNVGDLTLGESHVVKRADITSASGSIYSDGELFKSDETRLFAETGSLGANGNPLRLEALSLTLSSGYDIFVDNNDADLVNLDVRHYHDGNEANLFALTGRNLTFDVVDDNTDKYDLLEISDSTGIDFTFAGDNTVQVGTLDVKAGNLLTITAYDSSAIIDDGDGATELSGGRIRLNAENSVGVQDAVEVNTQNLSLISGYGINVSSNVDLSVLEIELNQQPNANPAPTFELTAPSLTFDVVDDGTITTINEITDTTGLVLRFDSDYSVQARTIDTQRYGYVQLVSVEGDIVGGNSGTERITAAGALFETNGGGGIGTSANPVRLSAPQLALLASGDIYIESDTHIDTLDVQHRHGSVGTYAFTSPSLTFTVSDDADDGLTITNITDTTGLDLRYSSDVDVTIGTINLGIAGDLQLSALFNADEDVDFIGDNDPNTLITASGIRIYADDGDIGTSVNPLQISAQSLEGFTDDGSAYLHFTADIFIEGLFLDGDSELSADGDIYIDDLDANGSKLDISTTNGSIYGRIDETSQLTLTATGGSIGTEEDPFSTSAVGDSITTLIATATGGGVYLEEDYGLDVLSVEAAGPVYLETDEGNILIGTVTATDSPVTLFSGEGIFENVQNPSLVTGSSVTLIAGGQSDETWSIGDSNSAVGVSTAVLTLDARGSMYIDNALDLSSLTIIRNAYAGPSGSSFGITAPNLTFTAIDNGNATTLTNVSDTTGLHFSFFANNALAVETINVGSSSDVELYSERNGGDGRIYRTGQNPLITARYLTLEANGFESSIGDVEDPILTSVATLDAYAGIGGIYIEQSGNLLLNEVESEGALGVATTSGNLTIGSVEYGNGAKLTLTAAGVLLDDGVFDTVLEGNGSGSITLGGVNGIGSALAPVVIENDDKNTINATVSGAGSAYLRVSSFADPTLNVTASDGSINLDVRGYLTLGTITSTTDAVGNNIIVRADGDFTLRNLTAGAQHGVIQVNNAGGSLLAGPHNSISAFDVTLLASSSIGNNPFERLNVTGQSITADSRFGSIYLGPTGIAVLGFVRSQNGEVDVLGTSDLLAANVLASNGLTLATTGSGARILAGNINAGNGPLTLSATNGVIVDDGVDSTRVIGGIANLTAAQGIGTKDDPLQTSLDQLSATVTVDEGAIYINESSSLQINNLDTSLGDIHVVAADALYGAGAIDAGGGSITLFAGEGGIDLTGNITTSGNAQSAFVDLTADTIGVANVTSTGTQTYHGDTTVGGNLSGGSITVEGTLDLAGSGTRELEATANGGLILVEGAVDGNGVGLIMEALQSGYIVFDADATNMGSLSANAAFMSFRDVLSTGDQNYKGDVRFYGDTYTTQGGKFGAGTALFGTNAVITTNGGEVSFNDTVNSTTGISSFSLFVPFNGGPPPANDLTVDAGNADVIFSGNVGDQAPMGHLVVNSSAITRFGGTVTATSVTTDAPGSVEVNGSSITTTGNQTYNDALSIGNDTTFTGATITFAGAVNGRHADEEELFVVGDAIFGGGAGTTTSLALIDVTGTAQLKGTLKTGGTQTYDGAITLTGDATFDVGEALTFDATIDGAYKAEVVARDNSNVTFNAAVGGTTRIGDLTVSSGGITAFNATVRAASVSTDAPGSVTINTSSIDTTGQQAYLDAATLMTDATLTGSLVRITGGLDDTVAEDDTLTINGNAWLGNIGASNRIKSLTVSGTSLLGGAIITVGSQTYNGAVSLATSTTLSGAGLTLGSTIDGNRDLSLIATDDSNIALGVVGGTTRLGGLYITTGGETRFNGAVSAAEVITDAPGTLIFNGGSIDTTGAQTYNDAAQLYANTVLIGTTVGLAGTLDDSGPDLHTLAINADATFGGIVGGTNALKSLGVNGDTTINTSKIITVGAQLYNGATTIGADTELTTSLATFNGAVNGATSGNEILNVKGGVVFTSGYGDVTPLESVMIQGTADLKGTFNTAGTQRFHNTITLSGDTTIDTTNGDALFLTTVDGAYALAVTAGGNKSVIFNEEIGSTTRIGALTINTSGSASFNGSVRAASISTDAPGTMEFNGGSVDTTGAQVFRDAAVMSVDTVLTGPIVTLNGAVNGTTAGAQGLTITGQGVLGGAVGSTTTLRSLSVSGATTINGGAVTTSGTQTYGGPILLGSSATLTGSLITAAAAINPTVIVNSLTINGDAMLGGNLGDQQALWFFDMNGAASIGGSITTIGDQTFHGAVTLTDDVSLLAGEGGGISFLSTVDGAYDLTAEADAGVLFDGAVGGTTRLGDIVINTGALTRFNAPVRAASLVTDNPGTLILNAGTVDTTGIQTYGEAVTLYSDTTLTGSTVTFGSTVDDSGIGLHALAIVGNAVLTHAVGNNIALKSLSVSGTSNINGGFVKSTGAQTYTGAVVVGTDTELTASLATFGSTLNGTTAGQQVFNVKGGVVFNQGFGNVTALESVMIQGTAGLNGTLNSIGTQRFHNTVTLLGDVVSNTTDGDAWFLTTVDGAHNLTVNVGGNKTIIFNEEVGNTTRIGNLVLNTGGTTSFNGSVRAASVATDGPGTVEIFGGLVDTTDTQTYGEVALLGPDTTLKGTTVTFADTLDASSGHIALNIEGDAVFDGAVGDDYSLESLAVTGTTVLNGGFVEVESTQSYGGAVTLAADTVLNGSDDVTFASTLNGAYDLTVNAGSGDVDFQGTVGGATRLQDIVVNTGGETRFTSVNAASILTDAPGTVVFNGGTIDTTGNQTYGENAMLAGDTTLVAPTVQLLGTLNDVASGQHALTVTGNAVFAKAVGLSLPNALRALSVSGTSAINGGIVRTTGAQTYTGAVTLGASTTLAGSLVTAGGTVNGSTAGGQSLHVDGNAVFNSGFGDQTALALAAVSGTAGLNGALNTTGQQTYGGAVTLLGNTTATAGGVTFSSTIDGAQALTVNAGNNAATFTGAIGGTTRLGNLIVNSGGATTFGNTVRAASVTTDSAGTVVLNGSAVDTSGAQSYGENFTLGANATLTGTTVTFAGAINDASAGQHALTITGNGVFTGSVGATTALSGLNVSGTSAINGGAIRTTGAQTYGGAMTLGANTTLTGSLVTTNATLNGTTAGQQSLNVVGNAVLNGGFGNQISLASVDVSGTSGLSGTLNTLGTQNYQGAITLLGATTISVGQNPLTFLSTIDGAQALTINAGDNAVSFNGALGGTTRLGNVIVNSGGATTFNGAVRAAAVTTDNVGTVRLNGGSVDTTGAQSYGEIMTLGADTTLTGTNVTLGGAVNAATAGQQALTIAGNGIFNGAVGNTASLKSLSVSGTSALGGGAVTTAGAQTYTGAMTFNTNTTLTSGGSMTFGSSINTPNLSSLNIAAPAGSVSVAGAIGSTGPLNQFVLTSGLNATLGAITANGITITVGTGATQFNGALTASTGAININNPNGTLAFAATAPINAATGFTQTGGAVQLASNVFVTDGPITFSGPLTLVGNTIVMETDGDITFAGISGPGTVLDLTAGTGTIKGGKRDGTVAEQITLLDMIVSTASSAELFGSLSGIGGGGTAKFIKSMLVGPPYYFNDVPWGPLEFVDRLIVQTADQDTTATQYTILSVEAKETGEFPEVGLIQGLRAEPAPDLLGVEDEQNTCVAESGCEVRTIAIQ